jgi:hypothetical protein
MRLLHLPLFCRKYFGHCRHDTNDPGAPARAMCGTSTLAHATHNIDVPTRGTDDYAYAPRGPGIHDRTSRGPGDLAHGPDVHARAFVRASCGLDFTLHPAPWCTSVDI